MSRVRNAALKSKIMSAQDAAGLIPANSTVGMSGFTGSGYPKVVPMALAERIEAEHAAGNPFRLKVWTGASTGPELDGALAKADGIEFRLPYNSDPIAREKINKGEMEYLDMHLSQVAPVAWQGFLGPLETAVVEVSGIREDGALIPSSSIGNNKTWLDRADQIILEVNSWQNAALEGMHDIYYGTALPPARVPIPLTRPTDLIGETVFRVDPSKIAAIVETDSPDRNLPFAAPDASATAIAGHLIEFLQHEVKLGRLPAHLLPLQSGVGNVANAVLAGLQDSPFENLTAYTEVLQDGMLDLLDSGKLTVASATAFSLSPEAAADLNSRMEQFRGKIILRPQEISNHPDRGRHLRQRQLDPRHGLAHPERHRRFGRLCAQRLHFLLRHAVDGQGRQDLGHRPHGQPRRPHHPGRAGHRHGTGAGRPARPVAQAARAGHHRQLRPPRLSRRAEGLLRSRAGRLIRPAVAAPADRSAVVAPALYRDGVDEAVTASPPHFVRRGTA